MAAGHVEIERKFEVGSDFRLPDLGGLPGVAAVGEPVEHLLEAVYHDTPDLRLVRNRVTLRRRSGGTDAGWHLKLPAVDGARRELHAPLGAATDRPPAEVLDPVAGLVRGAATGPVATLRTRRVVTPLLGTDGRVLAEVADDVVTGTVPAGPGDEGGTVLGWREVEVELVDGDEPLLAAVGARLEAAGARISALPSKVGRVLAGRLAALQPAARPADGAASAGDAASAALADQFAALQQADLAVRTGRPDGVHDLRVATRRLRAVLTAFRTALDPDRTRPVREELRWVARELSRVRDEEVALATLRDLVAAQPPELVLGPVAARLQQAALRAEQEGAAAARAVLEGDRYLGLLDTLAELLADPPLTEGAGAPADAVLRDALRRRGRRLRRRLAALDRAADADRGPALHAVRRAARQVRYTAELAEPLLGRRAGKLVRRAKKVQGALGERQDTVLTREHCRRIGLAAAAAGENAWTYGRLHGLEEARARRAEDRFAELVPALTAALRAVRRS
ncbi:MAG TPA: CYTH and CHAD domain-containing protein [Geodermatophilus sp.]|nr:CYTH and CHAD domain-containing protein [Geodermatophilus sp.]